MQRLQRGGNLSRQEPLCEVAARSGQLEKLKLLRQNDTPWDTKTCWAVARGRHLEVLKLLHANDCPWDEATFSLLFIAAQEGHEAVVRALIEAGMDVNK